MKSIQSKILLVVIAGLVVITAAVSMIAVNMTHGIMHKDADRILNNVTQKEAAYINDVLGDIKKSSKVMEHYAKAEIASLEELSDPEFVAKYLEKNKKMFLEIALNTNGIEGFFLRLNPEFTDNKTGFYNLIEANSTVKEMPITDLSDYSENDTKNVGWYYTAVQKGEAVWLEPYYFPGHDSQLISYTVPMYIDSKLLGVIGFDMNFSYLLDRIENISVYDNGYAVLVATDGETAYNSVEIEASKNPHTKATAALQNGMYLELRADYKDIQKDIHPMLQKIIYAFIIILILSIIYTILVTRRIVKPLKRLTAAAEKVSEGIGDTDLTEIPIYSKDEIGTLSRALTNTYSKIQEYTTYINALAYRDSLTGIKNSTAYTEAISELNKEILTDNPQFGVIVADINNLKETNDKYGHDIGNNLIIHTSKILTNTFKNSAVYRIGGDEFAVILKGTDCQQYRPLLKAMDEECSHAFITVCEKSIPVSVARGISIYDPSIDRVYEDVFSKADHAMYLHKEESKAAMAK